jgi:hypothetical protein
MADPLPTGLILTLTGNLLVGREEINCSILKSLFHRPVCSADWALGKGAVSLPYFDINDFVERAFPESVPLVQSSS